MEYVNVEIQEPLATVTIDRPKALNALNQVVLLELHEAVDTLVQNSNIQVVILQGGGDKAFVAGADIKEMQNLTVTQAEAFASHGQELTRKIAQMPQVFIASVKGFALGGGCELALACDLIFATSKSKFGQPEVGLGVIAGFGGTQRLVRLVGEKKAKELLLTGKIISSEEALSMGMINAVWEEGVFQENLDDCVKSILKNSPMALWRTKMALNLGADLDLNSGLSVEKQQFAMCFQTKEQAEGMAAFIEKRKAKFR